MAQPLMPKATAVWLIDNTALTFEQIGDFCGLHPLEVQAIADGEVAVGIVGRNPIEKGDLTQAEISRCEGDKAARLKMATTSVPRPASRTKGPRYTPMARRQTKPDGIAYLLRHHPELTDSDIVKLIGTTKDTITKIRDRSHKDIANIKARHPVDLQLCTYVELNAALERAKARLPESATPPEPQFIEPEAPEEEDDDFSRGEPLTPEAVFGKR